MENKPTGPYPTELYGRVKDLVSGKDYPQTFVQIKRLENIENPTYYFQRSYSGQVNCI